MVTQKHGFVPFGTGTVAHQFAEAVLRVRLGRVPTPTEIKAQVERLNTPPEQRKA